MFDSFHQEKVNPWRWLEGQLLQPSSSLFLPRGKKMTSPFLKTLCLWKKRSFFKSREPTESVKL